MSRITIERGPEPLPFFAEYPYYLWGEVNYDSDGDCERPTDRAWKSLELMNRDSRERLTIECSEAGRVVIEGASAREAAALTMLRTGGPVADAPADHIARLARADQVRAQLLDANLAAFDSFGWWGGWKWIGEFSTDLTSGLRIVLQSVHEQRLVDAGLLDFLRAWQAEPPEDFHRDGVAFAVEHLARFAR